MAEPIRVDLAAPLEGHHILVDPDELTFGVLEDFESERAIPILAALQVCIVGGDLPHGIDHAGLRRLKPAQIRALLKGVGSAYQIPKS